ncbi:MAG: hypothetical protein HFI50_05600 [Lachnospiraceae bacterium]|nr:hypothetical protein [Lachnospiraceae bacterium]
MKDSLQIEKTVNDIEEKEDADTMIGQDGYYPMHNWNREARQLISIMMMTC